jgi:hypothetical protein
MRRCVVGLALAIAIAHVGLGHAEQMSGAVSPADAVATSEAGVAAAFFDTTALADYSSSATQCDCCRCYPCECAQKPAPCIECPHVSTLLPNWNVNIFGALQANMMFNTARPVAPGIPLFLFPGVAQPENTVDVHARSSSLGALLSGPEVHDFKAGGVVMALFYNDALIVDRYGVLPIQAFGELRNEDWRFAAGLQFNVFAPNLPTMLTFSALLASGNAGNNFPGQFRVERYLHPSDDAQWTFQAALSDPIATGVTTQQPISSIITGTPAIRVTEDNGWPNIEGRVAYAVGEKRQEGLEARRAFEIGASAVGGQLRTAIPFNPNVVANTYGVSADLRWRVNEYWGIVGEAFVGEGLGFLNAGVLQSTNSATFRGIRTRGAWGEIYYYFTPLSAHPLGIRLRRSTRSGPRRVTNYLQRNRFRQPDLGHHQAAASRRRVHLARNRLRRPSGQSGGWRTDSGSVVVLIGTIVVPTTFRMSLAQASAAATALT